MSFQSLREMRRSSIGSQDPEFPEEHHTGLYIFGVTKGQVIYSEMSAPPGSFGAGQSFDPSRRETKGQVINLTQVSFRPLLTT